MILILSIETSTKVCSVSLHADTQLLACFEVMAEKSHSSAITVLIEKLFAVCGYQYNDLSAVAVAQGPGSYTGLRIGIATAKGICFALDKPLIAVNTLESMAFSIKQYYLKTAPLFCPMIDARRMEVYCAVYNQSNEMVLPVDARIITKESFKELLEANTILFFGDGAAKCKALLSYSPNALFLSDFYPTSKSVGILALQKFKQNTFEDIAYFEPFYLKEFFMKKANK